MRIGGLPMCIRRMLVRLGRVFMSGLVVVLPMLFRSGAMGFRGVFVVCRGFRMSFLGHWQFS
jgi:hypothetical protein